MRDRISDEYFEWLLNIVCGERYSRNISYRRLLSHLHDIEFTYIIPNDSNRAEDGIDLRYRFSREYEDSGIMNQLAGPCSVLEMMVALSIRCEENIMDDPGVGNRSRQWFWGMVTSLGLGGMIDDIYDPAAVDYIIDRFLNREYEPDGRGGLFTIKNCECDLRKVEIWYQLCWYLDNFV